MTTPQFVNVAVSNPITNLFDVTCLSYISLLFPHANYKS